jgi:3-hydroxyacyl-[acyl-carrier-protein] dehydratase
VSPNADSTPEDDPGLRDLLKRCSSATYYAACKFRKSGRREDLQSVVNGVVECFTARDRRPKLQLPNNSLRLREDLGIDSLTMMEIVMIAEEVLGVSVSNAELTHLCTLADVQTFLQAKLPSQGLFMKSGAHD